MTASSDRLIAALVHLDSFALGQLARAIDVPSMAVRRAARGANGQATNARVYLRVCMKLSVDPMTGAPREQGLAEFRHQWFGIVMTMTRMEKRHNIRQAAAAIGISKTTLSRIECGNIRSFDVLAAACLYVGRHPYDFLERNVSHETLTGDKAVNPASASL